jgi:hypothetical protein
MALFRQHLNDADCFHRWIDCAVRGAAVLAVLMAMGTIAAAGQVEEDGTGMLSHASAYMTVGGEHTQLPYFADNALGFDLGVSYQPRALLGMEFRAGAYPIKATYTQMGFTAGYRVVRKTIFGFPYAPFVYFGAGTARSQDKGIGRTAYPPMWEPCWQADLGFDRTYYRFSWRVAQISWRETYTPLHSLHSVGLSTGIMYRFPHS